MLPNYKAPAGQILNRAAPSTTFPAAAVAAAFHGVRAAMPLDLLPGQNPIVNWYHCRQPTFTPRPFPPQLSAAGSTLLLFRATLPYQITPLVGCTRLAAMHLLAENADNPIFAASTTNLLKWSAYGK